MKKKASGLAGRKSVTKKEGFSEGQKNFCFFFSALGDAELAARLSGYTHPTEKAVELLRNAKIREEISRFAKERKKLFTDIACAGFERLAFGDISDAVRLAFKEYVSDEEVERMNLINVAEIKRTRDKTVEIKFFDRIKALEKLREGLSEGAQESLGIFDMLKESAAALRQADEHEA